MLVQGVVEQFLFSFTHFLPHSIHIHGPFKGQWAITIIHLTWSELKSPSIKFLSITKKFLDTSTLQLQHFFFFYLLSFKYIKFRRVIFANFIITIHFFLAQVNTLNTNKTKIEHKRCILSSTKSNNLQQDLTN